MEIRNIKHLIILTLKYYYEYVHQFVEYLIVPAGEFIENYSSVLGNSVKNIASIVANIILLSPIILSSLLFGYLTTSNNSLSLENIQNLNFEIFIIVTLALGSVTAFIISHYIIEDRLANTLYLCTLLLLGVIPIYYLSTPAVYVAIFAIIYGIGGYTSSKIDLQEPVGHYHVLKNLEPQKYIITFSIISSILLIPSLYFVFKTSGPTRTYLIILVAFITYSTAKLQIQKYKTFYELVGLKLSSQVWILTPKIMIIIGIGGLVISNQYTIVYSSLLFTPAVFGVIFYYYINKKAYYPDYGGNEVIISDTNSIYKNEDPAPNLEVNIKQQKVEDRSAKLDLNVGFSFDERLPEGQSKWIESIYMTNQIYILLDSMKGIDDDQLERIESFYDDLVEKLVENKDEPFELKSIEEPIQSKIISELSKKNDINNQEIMDIIIYDKRDICQDDSMYVDKN